MTKDEALKLALEALDHNLLFTSMMPGYDGRIIEKAYKAINKALAQERSSDEQPAQTDWEAVAADQAMTIALLKAEQPAQQEPYCWMSPEGTIYQASDEDVLKGSIPMYLGKPPAQRKPLPYSKDDMEGLDCNQRLGFKLGWKSAEEAHGIKGDA